MKKVYLLILAAACLSLGACKSLGDFDQADVQKAADFVGCVQGCYNATEADPALLTP